MNKAVQKKFDDLRRYTSGLKVSEIEIRGRVRRLEKALEQQIALNNQLVVAGSKATADDLQVIEEERGMGVFRSETCGLEQRLVRIEAEQKVQHAEIRKLDEGVGQTWRDVKGNVRRIVDLDTSHLENILKGGFAKRQDTIDAINAELARRAESERWRKKLAAEKDEYGVQNGYTVETDYAAAEEEARERARRFTEKRLKQSRDRLNNSRKNYEARRDISSFTFLKVGQVLSWKGEPVKIKYIWLRETDGAFCVTFARLGGGIAGETYIVRPLTEIEGVVRYGRIHKSL